MRHASLSAMSSAEYTLSAFPSTIFELKKNDFSSGTSAQNKKITISGVSGKSAAGNSRKKLSELLTYIGTDLFLGEGTGIALNGESFKTDILNISEKDLDKIYSQVLDFLRFVKE